MRALHISDLHFRASSSYDEDLVCRTLLEHVAENSDKIDCVFVTGDIAFSGQPDEYMTATSFFEAVVESAKIDKRALFIVPGNHDVSRKDKVGLARTLQSNEQSDQYFDKAKKCVHIRDGQSHFADWYDNFYEGIRSFNRNGSTCDIETFSVGDAEISVSLVNSAVFSEDDADQGKLWIGRRSIDSLGHGLSERNSDVKIVMLHHPTSWLHEAEQSRIRNLLNQHFHIVLSGHLHEGIHDRLSNSGGDAIYLTAGATYQGPSQTNSAFWLQISKNEVVVEPIRYEESPVPVWTRDPALFPRKEDQNYCQAFPLPDAVPPSVPSLRADIDVAGSEFDLTDRLFCTPSGKRIFASPRITDTPFNKVDFTEKNVCELELDEIAFSSISYRIESQNEHGGSTIASILHSKLVKHPDFRAISESANRFPNYAKKIEERLADFAANDLKLRVLIIDDYSEGRHKRLVGEIEKTELVDKLVLIVPVSSIDSSLRLSAPTSSFDIENLYLWGWDRSRIRESAKLIFDTNDEDIISQAVDKTYKDLLGLAIPLTPVNVIMYLRILWREQDFHPLDRVNIMEKYLSEVLAKPTDAFAGSFNTRNKIDLISRFIFDLYQNGETSFTDQHWSKFCRDYSDSTLVIFDRDDVLEELLASRVFLQIGNKYCLRYNFLYAYFVGRHICNRPEELTQFLAAGEHLRLDGLVETICALSTAPERVLVDLMGRVNGYLDEYHSTYINADFDPLAHARWPDSNDEEEKLWEPIRKEIDAGPVEPERIDELKSSLVAEARTGDQTVVFKDFTEMEENLFQSVRLLEDALVNSDDAPWEIKLDAYRAVIAVCLVVLQVGAVMSGILARTRYVRWGGVVFINAAKDLDTAEDVENGRSEWIIPSLNMAIGEVLARAIGTKKLGGLFLKYESLNDEISEFERYLNLVMLVDTKPPGWEIEVERIIRKIDRNVYRLYPVLRTLRSNFKEDINRFEDQDALKELISLVRAKRSFHSDRPGKKAIGRVKEVLESKGEFDEEE